MVTIRQVSTSRSDTRGQVLPLWAASVVLMFALAFTVLNYGNQIRWQIRAQNAADSAASAAMSIQAQRFNLTTEMLYATNIEEYRMRRLLDGLLLSIDQSGGCTVNPNDLADTSFGTCGYVYAKLHDPYIRSFTRFSNDLIGLQHVNGSDSFANWIADSNIVLAHLQANCNAPGIPIASYHPDGGDCSFNYSIAPGGIVGRKGLHQTNEDAESILIPSLGRSAPILDDSQGTLWTPGEIDVVTCAVIPPIVPNFGPFHFAPVYAVGRGAATNVMVEQDWMQPGALIDPIRSATSITAFKKFQPVEDYVDNVPNNDFSACSTFPFDKITCIQDTGHPDWYNVNFGGADSVASSTGNYFSAPLYGPEMSVRTGWWGVTAIKPFGTSPILGSPTCK